jgi:pimeloyl-ACP methyl ester carboxylesterase
MWEYLMSHDFNLITWNQRDPNGSYARVLEELEVIIEITRATFPGKPIVLLSHSRGGLVIRKYVQEKGADCPELRTVILLGCPHAGSKLTNWVDLLDKLSWLFLPYAERAYREAATHARLKPELLVRKLKESFSRFLAFVRGDAIDEMKPHSPLLKDLKRNEDEEIQSGTRYVNVLGDSNTFTKLYLVLDNGARFKQVANFFADLPDFLIPDELADGKGDGLVALSRAKLPWAASSPTLPVNHASLLTDDAVKALVKEECDI